MSRFQARSGERLHWRAHVTTVGDHQSSRASHGLSLHLVECADPIQLDAHCPVGVEMLSTGADPDGHCLVNGTCPRCTLANAPVPPTPLPADSLERSSDSPSDLPVSPGVS